MKGVDDLDFFIGDEAIDKPTYATKVSEASSNVHSCLQHQKCNKCCAESTCKDFIFLEQYYEFVWDL